MPLDIFSIKDDWTKPPSQSVDQYRTPIQYPGSGMYLRNITDDIRIKFTSSFTNLGKSAETAVLEFFSNHSGRQKAFWAIVPKSYFTVTATIGASDTTIQIADPSPVWLRPRERVALVTYAGSVHHARVVAMTSSTMQIDHAFGVSIAAASVAIFTRLIYCRFDQDEVVMVHTAPGISECELSFIELPMERLS